LLASERKGLSAGGFLLRPYRKSQDIMLLVDWFDPNEDGVRERVRGRKLRIKTQTVLPCAETAATLFWALMVSGRSPFERSTAGQSLAEKLSDQLLDLAA
jgi:hypothetical protein